MAGGIGLCVVLILYLPLVLGIILALPVALLSAALAFYRINNKTFIEILEAGFNYYTKNRLYLWRKEDKGAETLPSVQAAPVKEVRQKLGLSQSRLHDLAWSLDVKDQNTQP